MRNPRNPRNSVFFRAFRESRAFFFSNCVINFWLLEANYKAFFFFFLWNIPENKIWQLTFKFYVRHILIAERGKCLGFWPCKTLKLVLNFFWITQYLCEFCAKFPAQFSANPAQLPRDSPRNPWHFPRNIPRNSQKIFREIPEWGPSQGRRYVPIEQLHLSQF